MALLHVEDLTKIYRTNVKKPGLKGTVENLFRAEWTEKAAIDGISFSMEEGESLACIGENGAGKSTLIKMLVGILKPTAGTVEVYGGDPMNHHREYLRKIGVVFGQKTSLWSDIPVIESYNAAKVLYKLDDAQFQRNKDMVIDLLDLAPILDRPARKLSLGQRMKADIGLVFLHSPRILFLDEPTIGLDINVKHAIRQFIRTMNEEQGVSVLLTSHDLDDIDRICDNALVLSSGKIYFHGSIEELKNRYASNKVITIAGEALSDITALLPGAEVLAEGRKTQITYDATVHGSAEIMQAVTQCYDIEDITIQELGIDHVVARIFNEGSAAGAAVSKPSGDASASAYSAEGRS